jgi:hypothetical protein
MSIRRFLLPSLTAIVFAAAALVADAQTGPVGGPKTGKAGNQSGPSGPQQPAGTKGLNPERVASLFQAKGAQTSIVNGDNGQVKYTAVNIKLKTNDFNYDFNVVFMTYSNGVTNWYCTADLNNNASKLTQAQMQDLLKANWQTAGTSMFMIDPAANIVMIQSGRYDVTVSEQVFDQLLTGYLNNMKNNVNAWYTPAQ